MAEQPKPQNTAKDVITGEIGRVRQSSRTVRFGGYSPLLQHPTSIATYTEMFNEDAQVASIVRAVMLPILSTTWRLDPAGASDDVVEMVSQDLRLPIIGATPSGEYRGRVSWQEHLELALFSLVYGHAYFEKVYEVREEDHRVHLRKLATRPQETISRITVDLDGGLRSITQKSYYDGDTQLEEVEIPVDRLLAYTHQDRKRDWIGQSMLAPAFKPWMYKLEELEIERIAIERTGVGLPVYTSSEDDDEEDIQWGQDLVESLRSGDTSGASIRNNSHLDIKGVSGQVYPAGDAIARHNAEIAKSMLAHVLNLDGKGGSYALAEVQMGTFIQQLHSIAAKIADVATHYLVEEMVRYYTGDTNAKAPRIVFDDIEMKRSYTSSQIAELVNAKVIYTDSTLEEHVRRQGGLPEKQSIEERAEEKQARIDLLGETQEGDTTAGEDN